jgi:hypothetical protein
MFIWWTRTGHAIYHLALLVTSYVKNGTASEPVSLWWQVSFLSRRAINSHTLLVALAGGTKSFAKLYGIDCKVLNMFAAGRKYGKWIVRIYCMGSKHKQAHRTSRDVKIQFAVQTSPKMRNLYQFAWVLRVLVGIANPTNPTEPKNLEVLMYSVPESKTQVLAGSEP